MRPSFRVLLHGRRSSHDPVHIYRPFDIEASVGPLGDAEEAWRRPDSSVPLWARSASKACSQRQVDGAAGRQGDVDERRNERRMFGGIEADQLQGILEVGEALGGRRVGVAETLASPFGDRVQRRILQQLRRRKFGPGVRHLAEPGVELLDEPRLADAGLADDLHELALAGEGALQSSRESRFEALHASGLTALVGREEETELLLRRWMRTKAGEGQVVLLSGEAGMPASGI